MNRLSQRVLGDIEGAAVPLYDRSAVRPGVVHIGLGAFARAHVARYCDEVIAAGHDDAGLVGVSLRSGVTTSALARQDGLYTLVETDGVHTDFRVVGSVVGCVDTPAAAVDAIAADTTSTVTLTVTEKGYHHSPARGRLNFADPAVEADLVGYRSDSVATTPGVLVAGLRRRRDLGRGPVAIVSCDNLDDNGGIAETVVLDFAEAVDTDLAAWVRNHVAFPATVVDRIVPAATEADRSAVSRHLGYSDAAAVRAEQHCSWIVQATPGLPAWDRGGARFVSDVGPWQQRKLRAVNGPHSALAYLGGLAGHCTIDAAATDPSLADFVTALVEGEVATTLTDTEDAPVDVAATLARFSNRALGHRCDQVAADGSRKMRQRVVDVIAGRRRDGLSFDRSALVVAAWMTWVMAAADGRHRLIDPDSAALIDSARSASTTLGRAEALFATPAVFDPDVADDAEIRSAVLHAVRLIDHVGASEAARRST